MKVTLIDYTGAGHSDPFYAARILAYVKNTRLTQGGEGLARFMAMPIGELNNELDYIANTIRSSWEFVGFTFQIEGVTRAFTHQFVRTRNASYAQQAMRVADMGGFEALLPTTVAENNMYEDEWNAVLDRIKKGYQFLRNGGIPAQDARGLLPTNVLTNIAAYMNLRTLADLAAKRINARVQEEYNAVAQAMVDVAKEKMPWIHPFLFPERTATPALDTILRRMLGTGSPIDNKEVNDALKELDALKGTWG